MVSLSAGSRTRHPLPPSSAEEGRPTTLLGGSTWCAPALPLLFHTPAPVLLHLVEVLLLIVVEYVANLTVAAFHDAPHLAPSVLF